MGMLEITVPEPRPRRALAEVRSAVKDFVQFGVAAALVVAFIAQPVRVEGTSMLPELHDGERIVINKLLVTIGQPVERGDVVVFYYPNDPSRRYVKRVIGLPGDTVRIDDRGRVFLNGKRLDEPYLSPEYTKLPDPMPATTVSPHHYFVMGDNRDNSSDSRQWGLVPEGYICGEAVFRFWPLAEVGVIR
jgi:signal peptidase I